MQSLYLRHAIKKTLHTLYNERTKKTRRQDESPGFMPGLVAGQGASGKHRLVTANALVLRWR